MTKKTKLRFYSNEGFFLRETRFLRCLSDGDFYSAWMSAGLDISLHCSHHVQRISRRRLGRGHAGTASGRQSHPECSTCHLSSRNKRLISRLLGPADLSGVSLITNPLNAALSCRDVITAYDTVPRSLNSVVTAFDAFEGRSLGTGVPIYSGKANTGLPNLEEQTPSWSRRPLPRPT